MTVTLRGPGPLVILDPWDEPLLRLVPAGVFVNSRSPARVFVTDPAVRIESLRPPSRAGLTPRWKPLARTGDQRRPSVTWYEPRAQWPATKPPADIARLRKRATISYWTVPARYDGQPLGIAGHVDWVPPPIVDPETGIFGGLAILGALGWIIADRKTLAPRLAQASAVLVVAGVTLEAIRIAATVRETKAPLLLAPGLVLVLLAVPRIWRRERHANAIALLFAVYLIAFTSIRPHRPWWWLELVVGGLLAAVSGVRMLPVPAPGGVG
jgi:hypothetical protein